ncbi:MAG: peptide deformylase [Geminicoccaceae bacterium]
MALLPILEVPHPMLRQKTTPVGEFDDRLRRLVQDMLDTMYKAPGIGLAGPQVGVLQRIFVMDVANKEKGEEPAPRALINPEIVWASPDMVTMEEGCLSLPQQYADVTRPSAVKVTFHDEHGAAQELEGDGLFARCVQHELDHLDGVLFVDHISALRRSMILKKLAKSRKAKA